MAESGEVVCILFHENILQKDEKIGIFIFVFIKKSKKALL
jgi:hypothetical protein